MTESAGFRVPADTAAVDDRCPDAGAGRLHGPLPLPLDQVLRELLRHGEDVHLPALHGAHPAVARTHQVGWRRGAVLRVADRS